MNELGLQELLPYGGWAPEATQDLGAVTPQCLPRSQAPTSPGSEEGSEGVQTHRATLARNKGEQRPPPSAAAWLQGPLGSEGGWG